MQLQLKTAIDELRLKNAHNISNHLTDLVRLLCKNAGMHIKIMSLSILSYLDTFILQYFIISVISFGMLIAFLYIPASPHLWQNDIWGKPSNQRDSTRLVSTLLHSGSVKPIGILYVVLSCTNEPDMSEPQQTGQNVRSLRCDDRAASCLSWWSGNEFPEQAQKLHTPSTPTAALHWADNTPLSCTFTNTYTCCHW